MTVTIFRVLPENPGITDYVSSDEMTARAKAEEMGASLCSREFQQQVEHLRDERRRADL